jgi:hypothetical protein
MPLSLYVLYASCNACSIFLIEASPLYFFYSSCLNSFYSCIRYTGKELYHAYPIFPYLCLSVFLYSSTSVTTPAPTVLPPSLIANLSSFSIAIGAISSTTRLMLSPGIIISTPSGSCTTPVTSVVLK